MMDTVIMICVVVATIAFVMLVVQAIHTLKQLTHTGKAVEYLALNADSKLTALDPMVTGMKNVSGILNNAWFRVAGGMYGLISKISGKK